MLKLIKSELFKMRKRKMIYVMAFIMFIMPIFGHGMSVLIQSFGIEDPTMNIFADMTMLDFIQFSSKDVFTGGTALIMVLVIGVNLLCEEYNSGMLKMTVMASSRKKVVISKLITMAVYTLILTLSHLISALIVGSIFYGNFELSEIMTVVYTYGYGILSMLVYGILMMNFGFLFNKGTAAIASGFGLYIVFTVALQITPPNFYWMIPIGHTMLCVSGMFEQFAIQGLISGLVIGTIGVMMLLNSVVKKELIY